ncbi:PKD domain-containing protein [Cellulomonas fimi]|uniref:PKD domain containing protein n=1 Tax=Cellulomonas fimi (strain ATCC 484 / DSM 20113 / JCM 1341 / CCUG 24087 / LMG 16345 / NBRC 15513 / NCIMB 8980 / NCTC 7547 / NRS-133) TaxID=590998 RepID=F4GYN8_CELFA|nr:PKD domain-containing protein [Cellulomonas fimi]AEE47155.1 PKD domain containing protein [Cellulomonas fimi ATCC 484]NNH07708.1 PKD domain-containing protein [Cellulomonas fimi]VEH35428.1 Protease 1 precursor [Cellulomonas fimi]
MTRSRGPVARSAALLAAAALTFAGVTLATPAAADTVPVAGTTVTVAADSLPTVQIDGVAWQQGVAGSKVFVGGDFANARPAGSAAGTNLVPRANLLAYDLTTGVLDASWAPDPNAQVRAVAVSPDGSRVYVGGSFTTIAGQPRYRIAAFDAATGALVSSFAPGVDSQVRAIAATDTAVYVGGTFTNANGEPRSKVAAFSAADGSLLPWAPSADNGSVSAMVVSPDRTQVIVGGSFTTFNGSGNPGYGLARVDATTGATLPLAINGLIRNGSTQASITSVTSDATSFYVTGYVFGSTGNLEGTARGDWATGALVWVEDCHGDTYAAWPGPGDAVYVAGHPHYCGNIGGFPQTEPWTFYRGLAFSKSVTGTATADPYGYHNYAGQPTPSLLAWYPDINSGSYTGQGQGPWTVTGNDQYLLYGGEFTIVNNKGQQGLARFARTDVAPNKQGPRLASATWPLAAASFQAGTVRLSWPANYDRDNENLTYTVSRNGQVVHTVTAASVVWKRPQMGFLDTGLTPGASYTYRVKAVDPFGNQAITDQVQVTVSDASSTSAYAQQVAADGATSLWRLGEPGGTTAFDWVGWSDLTLGTGVTRGAAGAIGGDANAASTFDGTSTASGATSTPVQGPDTFAVEAWVRTTSTRGGKIVGFSNQQTGQSGSYDRHVYMDDTGRITFGVYPGAVRTITTNASYNDGQWHHVVASMGAEGMKLFVDGRRAGQRADTTYGQAYTGYWRIGGDNVGGWPNQPTSGFLAGSIDDVAVYPAPLTVAQVEQHYTLSGRTVAKPPAPADAYGKAVYDAGPELYWRLSEGSGTTAADSGPYGMPGTYRGTFLRGQSGALSGVSNPAVRTLGTSNTLVASSQQFSNPTVYSQELWFRTSTTNGGKLIGFGDKDTGVSGSYDRHVYMETDGRLTFGTWTGVTNTITTTASYNDSQWHHLVATQGPDGMRLYVDGVLQGTHPQTAAQAYNGYWRVFGDTTWGPQAWFAGTIDEVAVYSSVLDAQTVANHHALGTTGQLPNQLPVAAFTSTPTDLAVAFDATGSSDPDGTVASYAWAFGDGATATGATPTHTFAAGGTYTVTLTVTDDDGATAQVAHDVTVVPPNQLPTAGFTATPQDLTVAFDGGVSTDPDGTITQHAWTFGDGTTGEGPAPTHTYAAGGDYEVTLTVTDDRGGSAQQVRTVTVVAPNQAPVAAFDAVATDLTVAVDGSASTDADGTLTGHAWDFGDGTTGTGATASHTYGAAGTYTVTLTVTDDDGETGTTTREVAVAAPVPNQGPVAAFTATPTHLAVAVDASASTDADGQVTAYAWEFGDSATATGATASHTYAVDGTYTITLVTTDDDGDTGTTTREVTVAAPPADTPFALDPFARSVTGGWGAADTGGAWSVTGGAANFSVAAGTGAMRVTGAGYRLSSFLPVSSTSTDLTAKVALDVMPTGAGTDLELAGRTAGTTDGYRLRLKMLATGVVRASLVGISAGSTTTVAQVNVPGLTYTAGQTLQVRLQVDGTGTTALRAKVWAAGTPEPAAWTLQGTSTTAALQVGGGIGLSVYTSSTSTTLPLTARWSELAARPVVP